MLLPTFVRPASLALALFAALQSAVPASAVTLTWNNAAGGFAGVAANWNPAQAPTSADQLVFNTAATYGVTFGVNATASTSQFYRTGDVSLTMNAPHDVGTSFHVADQAGNVVTARLTSGTLLGGWSTFVGSQGGADGTFLVTGDQSSYLQNTGGAVPILALGGSGTGRLKVFGGALVQAAGLVNIGLTTTTARGELTVDGENKSVTPTRSRFFADDPGADMTLGRSGAYGSVSVTNGGLARVQRYVWMSTSGTSDSSDIVVSGGGAGDSARFTMNGDLQMAFNTNPIVGGGTARVTAGGEGVIAVADSTVVGDPNGSDAKLTVLPGGRFVTKHLILQQPAGVPVDLQGGLLQVKGGKLSTNAGRLGVPGAADTARIELLSGATCTLTDTAGLPPLNLGQTSRAELRVLGGSILAANGSTPVLGQSAGGSGRLVVRGNSAFTSNRRVILGQGGYGSLFGTSGGTITADGLDLGTAAASNGYVYLSDAGSAITSGGPLDVGGTALAAGGTGQVIVENGAAVHLNGALVAGSTWGSGTIYVGTGSTLDMNGVLTHRGLLQLSDGTVAGGALLLRDFGRVFGHGTLASGLSAPTDTTTTIEADGPLTIGAGTPLGHVLFRGLLRTHAEEVTVQDPDSAVFGTIQLEGGTLRLPAGGGVVEPNRRLFGQGTVLGNLVNHGRLISVGGSGLTFSGAIYGGGQGLSGELFQFLPNAGFLGAGTIDAAITTDTLAWITATGNLDLGRNVPNPLTLRGRVDVGPYSVRLRSANDVNFPGTLALGGGQTSLIGGAALLDMTSTSQLLGRGTVNAPLATAGVVSPGASAGRLRVNGAFTLQNTGLFVAELGNRAANEWDTLSVSGNAVLFGNLDVRTLPTFAAAAGDSFKVLECVALAGTFANVTLNGLPSTGVIEVRYRPNGVWVALLQNLTLGAGDPPAAGPAVTALHFAPLGSPGTRVALELALPASARADVRVFDVAGREVAVLARGALAAGRHRFDASRALSGTGVFFARAELGEGAARTVKIARFVQLR